MREHYDEHHDTCVCIIIPTVPHEILQYILDFIYCGKIIIPLSVQKEVLEAAKLLQILNLISYIEPEVKEQPKYEVKVNQEKVDDTRLHPKWKRKMKHLHFKLNNSLAVHGDGAEQNRGTSFENKIENYNYKRHRRKIKSRYDSDIYELSLPKLRDLSSKHLEVSREEDEKNEMHPKTLISRKGDLQSDSSKYKELFTHSCSSHHVDEDHKDNAKLVKVAEFSHDSKDDIDFKTTHHDPIKSNLSSLTLQSPCLLSVGSSDVVSNYFTTDSSYLHGNSEIPCTSFINSPVSSSSISKKLYPSPLAVGDSSSSVPHISELPSTSAPFTQEALENDSLKYIPSIRRPQEALHHPDGNNDDNEDDDDAEEEDGLFKLQVLLKDCEDFPETVTHHISNPMRSQNNNIEVKLEEPASGLDIRQWITEEVESPKIPKEVVTDKDVCESGNTNSENSTEVSGWATSTNESEKKSNKEEKKNVHKCHDCGKSYLGLQSLKVHVKSFHKEAKQMCKHCGKMFKRRSDLYDHERRHNEANLPCKMCGKIFKLKKDLAAHIRTHVGGKRYTCNQCGKELTSYRNLRNHIAGVHEKQRSYACHMCNKKYAKSRALQVHIRSVHTGERPFRCEICGKTFCNPCLLKAHEVSHTGEQKYTCKVCQRKFSQYCNMITHQRVHSNERPFVCTICKEGYKTRESLRKHKWIHTGLKPLRCPHCSKEYRIKESFERHMLKCHDEVVHLPQIYFEMSERVALESIDKESTSENMETLKSRNDKIYNVKINDDMNNKMQDTEPLSTAALSESIVPVVQFVNEISQGTSPAIQLEANGSGPLHLNSDTVQISYPILSANNNQVADDSTALANITNEIPSGNELASPIDSLLQVTLPGTNGSVLMTQDGKVNILLDC